MLNFFENKETKFNIPLILLFSFLLGLSVVVRPQMIFTIFPIFLWVIFFKLDYLKISLVFIGFICAIILGLYIDYINWGYFTNTYWQIYKIQILKGRMAAFGADPWWFYITAILKELAPIFSAFVLISIFIYCYKNLKGVFTWITIGTIIILLFFQHKETRFIFPIYIFAPFFLIYFFDKLKNTKLKIIMLITCLFFNFIFLFIISFFPINGKVPIYKFLYDQNITNEKVFYLGENPYQINEMEPSFYTSFIPKIEELKDLDIINAAWIITNDYSEQQKLNNLSNCKIVYSSYPSKFINLNKNWKNRKLNWYVNYCNS